MTRKRIADHAPPDVALLAVLGQRGRDADTSSLGDTFLLPAEFRDQPRDALNSRFGPDFTAALAELTTGQWCGPVRSGYGLHLVLVTERTAGRLPALEEVRESVSRDLMSQRRTEQNRRFLDDLLARYRVRIEWPTSDRAVDTGMAPP